MDALSGIAEIFRDLLIFIAVMTALLIALIVIISRMPTDNPLKRVLTALSYRVAATVAAEQSPSRSSRSQDSTCSMISACRSRSSGTGSRFSRTWVTLGLSGRVSSKSGTTVDE